MAYLIESKLRMEAVYSSPNLDLYQLEIHLGAMVAYQNCFTN